MIVPKAKKLKSGTWFIYLRLGGEGVSITGDTEKECVHKAELAKAQHLVDRKKQDRKPRQKKSDITLTQAIDKYIEKRKNLSPSTLRGYRIIQKNYFQQYMNKPMRQIKDWQAVYDSEVKRLKPYTLKNAWGLIKSVYKEETRQTMPEIVTVAPVRDERPFLDTTELETFLAAVQGENCEIGALLALHSLRASEIFDLTWEDIDLKKKRLRVYGAVVPNEDHKFVAKKTNKNDSSRRYVPIFIPRLEELLKQHYGDKKPVCRYENPGSLRRAINRVCKANNLPEVGVHGLRHSIASLMVLNNIPESVLQAVGGWKDSYTVHKIYTHVSSRDMEKELGNLTEFFSNSQTKKCKPSETVENQQV